VTISKAVHYLIRKLWLAVGVLLVIAAVLLSLVRYALPYTERYHDDLAAYLSEQLDYQVSFASLRADWVSSGPTLVIEDLNLSPNADDSVNLHVAEARVGVNFWQSLWNWELQFNHFSASGAEIDIHVQGQSDVRDPDATQDFLESLFLRQLDRFQLRDTLLRVYLYEQAPREIFINTLSWQQHGQMRQATGSFRVPDVTCNSLDFILNVEGDRFATARGSIYVDAQNLDITPWIQQLTTTARFTRAEFNLQGWLDFNQGQFGNGQLHFNRNLVSWRRHGEEHFLTTQPTSWVLVPQDTGWLLNSQPLEVRLDDRSWLLDKVIWEYAEGTHTWNAGNIELIDFSPLWSMFGAPGEVLAEWSEGLATRGVVRELQVRFSPEQNWQFYAQADELDWQPHRGVPGISGLQLEVWSTPSQGNFVVGGNEIRLNSPATYNDDKALTELDIRGGWLQTNGDWVFDIDSATFGLPGAEIQQRLRVSGGQQDGVTMDWLVVGGSHGMAVLDVITLLPLQMGENLGNYLTESLLHGEVDDLRMVWRGPINGFPYDAGEGIFQAQVQINQLGYKFQQSWPAIFGARADVRFVDQQLEIRTHGGEIAGIPLTTVEGVISQIIGPEAPHLHIGTNVTAEPQALHDLFAMSPLASSVAATLQQVQLQDSITGSFTLDIPLQSDAQVAAVGEIQLDGQSIYLAAVDMWLNDIQGGLTFHNDQIRFSTPSAQLFGQPVVIELQGGAVDGRYEIQSQLHGRWNFPELAERYHTFPLLPRLAGDMPWDAEFTLGLGETLTLALNLDGDLAESVFDLPEPIAHQRGNDRMANLVLNIDGDDLRATAQVADVIQARAEMVLGSGGLNALELQLGESPYPVAVRPDAGFHIYAGFVQTDLAQWLPLIGELYVDSDEQIAELNEPQRALVPPLSQIDGRIETLSWFGQAFPNSEIRGRSVDNGWQIDLNADNTRTRVDWNVATPGQLTIGADFLYLQAATIAETDETGDDEPQQSSPELLDNLPPVAFSCRVCRFEDRDLGEVRLRLRSDLGEQIERFEMRRGRTVLTASGGWMHDDGENLATFIQGNLNSNNIGSYLSDLGFSSVVRDSDLQLRYALNWPGLPTDFDRERLSGEVEWLLGAGYLRDVPDAARVFSVLSLESVIRKLTLDFRDIFARGMFYSSFGGTLQLRNGVVSTDNTRMNGAAGDMTVAGTTNLSTEAIHYQLTYVPKVTSSIPVLLAFMVNPPSGLAALLIDRMLHDAQVISRLQYEITGTMSEPVVNEVSRDSKEVELPEMAEDVLPRELPAKTEAEIEGKQGNQEDNHGTD